ncbi:MAG: substrate-binding domain-containing protein [Kiritimatiellae bacterium]|nr:substrate-binding domain-containing protein [Kiritimatiellia bacterium]
MKHDVKNGRRRVVAAVALDTHSGQRKLAGIMRFFNETLVPAGRPWDFEVQPNSFFVTPGWAKRARSGVVDGVILSDYPSDETMRLIARSGIPCVVETSGQESRKSKVESQKSKVENRLPHAASRASTPSSSSNVVRIVCDARELAREAAQNLVVRQSFVSFGYVGTAENEPWSRERGAFFKEALAERGRECAVFKSRRAGLGSWLASLPRPAAIFAANDFTAREVANAAIDKGLRIPDGIAVLGIDDDPKFCLSASPAISSVVQDFESCGFQAAEALQRLMDGDATGPTLLHYGARGVSIRKSTLSDSPHAALVQKALEVIDADADDPRFGVDEVARRLGVSRSLLDLRFREIERKSAHAVIRERRLEYASRLLAETKRSIEKITADCGFTNRTHLKKLFKTAFGCSMREWRRRSQKSG